MIQANTILNEIWPLFVNKLNIFAINVKNGGEKMEGKHKAKRTY